jgi:hypothetical protein
MDKLPAGYKVDFTSVDFFDEERLAEATPGQKPKGEARRA